MTNDRVDRLYDIVKNSSFSNRDILLGVLERLILISYLLMKKEREVTENTKLF
jgi:hypothetical protein